MINDADMLRRYADEKSDEAFAEFVRKSINLVYSAALRRTAGDAHAAADVVQEVFITAARHAPSLARHPCVTGWLYSATRNAALNLMRDESLRQQREREAQTASEMLATATPPAEWAQLRPVLDAAMDKLNQGDREAVLLRFFQQQSFVEMGQRWQLTENAARMRVERALQKLQRVLAKRGITSSAAALAAVMGNAVAAAPAGLAAAVVGPALNAGVITATTVAVSSISWMNVAAFMQTMKPMIALTLVAVGAGGYFLSEATAAARRAAALNRQSDELAAQLAALRSARSMGGTATADRPGMTNGSPTTTESRSPTVTTPATTNANVRAAITRDLLVNPDFNQLLLQRAIGDIYYGKGLFYLRQQMSPEQTTKFEALIAEALTEAWHVQTTAIGSAKDPKNDAETAERLRQTRLRLEEKIRALLGEKGLEAFVRHEREYPVHIFARGLAGELHVTNTPLTPTQAIGLVDVLLQHSSDFQQGKDAAVARIDWDRAFADATRILQPAQIDTLKARAATPRYRHRLAELTKTGKR